MSVPAEFKNPISGVKLSFHAAKLMIAAIFTRDHHAGAPARITGTDLYCFRAGPHGIAECGAGCRRNMIFEIGIRVGDGT
jgi:hypothetical protein